MEGLDSAPTRRFVLDSVLNVPGVAIITIVATLFFYYGLLPWHLGSSDNHDPELPSEYRWPTSPEWTPNGKQIVFSQGGSIYLAESDGSSLQVIHGGAGDYDFYHAPSISPDGRTIAYLKYRHGGIFWNSFHWEVATSALDGSGEQTLTDFGSELSGRFGAPSWSPDGRLIAFVHAERIYTITSDGWELSPIPRLPDSPSASFVGEYVPGPLEWSPDGTRLAFRGRYGGYTVGVDGSNPKKIAKKGTSLVWSPGGNSIAFAERASEMRLWSMFVRDLRRYGLRELYPITVMIHWHGNSISWSPDGSSILAGQLVFGAAGFSITILPQPDRVDPETGQAVISTYSFPEVDENSLSSWSPDGSTVAILTDQYSVLYTVDVLGGSTRVLALKGERGELFSGDGRPLWDGTMVTEEVIY